MSDGQRQRQATLVKGAAANSNLYNPLEVERWFLKVMKVPGVDKLLVKEVPEPQPPVEVQIEQMRMQAKKEDLQAKMQVKIAELEADREKLQLTLQTKMLELTNDAELNSAKIIELQAKAVLYIEQAGTAKVDEEIAMINAQIGAAKIHHESLLKSIKMIGDIKLNERKMKDGK
jgi:hypothetical protein